ncbi:FtsB family cell division protein [Micavibrio aeruginosavorus]|uniref:FtsB family cell division protein n=1 Tax=Micavibrio aeruginosavorus TaxID=349221 RepID=UPI003F4AA940
MRASLSQRKTKQRNVLGIIGICLTLYFSYHLVQGERSIIRLMTLEQSIAKTTMKVEKTTVQRVELEARVTRLRPGSLDPDLLEERARAVLGFGYADEQAVVLSQ